MFLAWKEMRYSKLRFSLIIGIMILVGYVVFMLSGLANGLADGHKKAIVDWDATSIILSEDSNKIASASQLTQGDLERVTADQKAAVGMTSGAIEEKGISKKTNISIFATEKNSFVVPDVIKGKKYQQDNQIIISQNLADDGYKIGDQINIGSSQTFKIVGISKATTYSVVPVVYTNLNAFTNLKYGNQPFASDATKPINLIAVKGKSSLQQVNGATKLQKLSLATFIENLPGFSAESLTLNTMIYFLFVVVAAIIGIFMYVMTLQKTAIFGVMKAQGIGTKYLVRSILAQALIVGVFGVVVAIVLSGLTSLVLPAAMPFTVNWMQWGIYSVILVIVAMLGGLFSVRTVTKVDPITAIGGE